MFYRDISFRLRIIAFRRTKGHPGFPGTLYV